MVVVGSVYEKNKIIKGPDQEIYARHFDRSLIRWLSMRTRFAQTAHRASCEPIKAPMEFYYFRPLQFIFLFLFIR